MLNKTECTVLLGSHQEEENRLLSFLISLLGVIAFMGLHLLHQGTLYKGLADLPLDQLLLEGKKLL